MNAVRKLMFDPARLPPPDEMGFFFHPDIPGEDEDDDVRALCRSAGFETAVLTMDLDAPELSDAWHDDDMSAPTRWHPTLAPENTWQLVAKFDTEDGPCALFVRPIAPAPGACTRKAVDEALLIQALRMRNEVFQFGGMSRETFTSTYIGEIDDEIRALARRENIAL